MEFTEQVNRRFGALYSVCYFLSISVYDNYFIYPGRRPVSQSTKVDRLVLMGDQNTRIYKNNVNMKDSGLKNNYRNITK